MNAESGKSQRHTLMNWWSALGMWVALLSSATTAAQIREATDMIDLCAAEISSLVEQITAPVD